MSSQPEVDGDKHRSSSDDSPLMNTKDGNAMTTEPTSCFDDLKMMRIAGVFFAATTIALLVTTIVLATKNDSASTTSSSTTPAVNTTKDFGVNPCDGKRPGLANVACLVDAEDIFATGEQSGVNVTKGYNGQRNTTAVPITGSYRDAGLCPVNVHWHTGTEHYSLGEYDETGEGPIDFHEGRLGFQCKYYDEDDPKFTTPYKWEHCIGMTTGQTYEVHWPHSSAGMCHTPWQYQTPFYDGVFCHEVTNSSQQVGVQSQIFTVVNDEEYFYPDLFTGMLVDEEAGKGVDLAIYTGSTTGTQRNNYICSPFSPITWQVDRKCHLISASSFDKMCGEMKQQADNMDDDLYAHGARELVDDMHAANNHNNRARRHDVRSLMRANK